MRRAWKPFVTGQCPTVQRAIMIERKLVGNVLFIALFSPLFLHLATKNHIKLLKLKNEPESKGLQPAKQEQTPSVGDRQTNRQKIKYRLVTPFFQSGLWSLSFWLFLVFHSSHVFPNIQQPRCRKNVFHIAAQFRIHWDALEPFTIVKILS